MKTQSMGHARMVCVDGDFEPELPPKLSSEKPKDRIRVMAEQEKAKGHGR